MKIELEVQILIQSALPSVKYLCQQNKKNKKSKIFQDLYIICILWYSWAFKGYSSGILV
jgi:hypothetical protein